MLGLQPHRMTPSQGRAPQRRRCVRKSNNPQMRVGTCDSVSITAAGCRPRAGNIPATPTASTVLIGQWWSPPAIAGRGPIAPVDDRGVPSGHAHRTGDQGLRYSVEQPRSAGQRMDSGRRRGSLQRRTRRPTTVTSRHRSAVVPVRGHVRSRARRRGRAKPGPANCPASIDGRPRHSVGASQFHMP
jgi:hypothetical protein